jgi:hypothetical protein
MESSELLAGLQLPQPVLVHSSKTTIRVAACAWANAPVRMSPVPKTNRILLKFLSKSESFSLRSLTLLNLASNIIPSN